MKKNKDKVLVGMSGGVDSSTAAGLLLEEGFDVLGVTIKPFYFYDYYKDISSYNPKGNIDDAKAVCKVLGIEHIVVDFFDYFKEKVVDYFVNEYLAGRTPNPCVKCNPIIKWGKLIETADKHGAKFIATGHYAKIIYNEDKNNFSLRKGDDINKDQSYFLWGLTQKQLARTKLPLAKLRKPQTRAHAKRLGLKIHQKAESQEVCFIVDNDYHNFLRNAIPDIDKKIGNGDIIFKGKVIGQHKGYPFYTIGQRKGLGITYKEALYVKNIDAKKNIIEVDCNNTLFHNQLLAHSFNISNLDTFDTEKKYNVKIRYRDSGSLANCKILDNGKLQIVFFDDKRAITPGQSVVIYDEDELIGGGVIE